MMSANHPGAAVSNRSLRSRRALRWALSLIILLTAGTLTLTLVLLVRALPAASPMALGESRPVSTQVQPQGRTVRISDHGSQATHSTTLENPQAILDEAGIELGSADKVWVNGALAHIDSLSGWTVPAHNIEIRRAMTLTVIDDGEESLIISTAASVGEALFQADISLYLSDQVSPPLESAIEADLTIHIKRAIPLMLRLDGVDIAARSNAATVADVLTELNAPLFGLDYVIPSADSPVAADMRIEIVRVTEEIVSEIEVIKHELEYRPDANLKLDQSAVVQPGSDGKREIRYRVRYENGSEVSRAHSETVELAAPTNRIVAYGTSGASLGTVQTPAGPRSYWRRLCVYITSYRPSSNGGNRDTATGRNILEKGIVAAKPNIIPYYTQVYVPGYGLGSVRDTGGGPSGTDYWIDLGYSENDYERWRKYDYVYLLGAPPDNTPSLLPAWTPASHYAGSCG